MLPQHDSLQCCCASPKSNMSRWGFAATNGRELALRSREPIEFIFGLNLWTNRVAARSIVIWVTAGFLVLLLFMGKMGKLTAPSGLNELVISVGM
jgi:hypothetical protein